MQKTNVELAREQKCTARQISKSRRHGWIMTMIPMIDEDGKEVLRDDGEPRMQPGRKSYKAPAPHIDPRDYRVQEDRRKQATTAATAKHTAETEALLRDEA